MAAWKSTLEEKMETKYPDFPDEIKDKIAQKEDFEEDVNLVDILKTNEDSMRPLGN
jgi:uncharacterized secreted protein with C-terminal beta-propeller domain